jgi:hypothetical protein
MSTVVDNAPFAAPLKLMDSNPALFLMRDSDRAPVTVTLPGSSNFDLSLFNVTAIGTAKPAAAGTVVITLYGLAKLADATTDPEKWLPIGSSIAEPIGGETDLPENIFMVRAEDLVAYTGTGKMQGTFKSNVASNPQAAIDLEHHPGDVTDSDPLYIFAVGASFTPTVSRNIKAGDDPEPLCTLTLASLSVSA